MRLIDADALIEKLLRDANCYMDNNNIKHGYHNVQCLIYDAPTIDAVPVVRCKDCVHGTDRTEDFQDGDERWYVVNPIDCMMYSSDGEPDFFPKDNYCGFGKRRKDEERETMTNPATPASTMTKSGMTSSAMDAQKRTVIGKGKTMIQIDIDMPKSCLSCPCSHGYDDSPFWDVYCMLLSRYIAEFETDRRQKDCPLKEVKDDE